MRKSLIYTRNADNSIMTIDRVRELAPAAFSTTKAEHLTDRYQPLHTAEILPVLADYGYYPTQAAQVRGKNGSEHKHHLIAFAKPETIEQELRPEIVLYNSHDGSGAVRLFAGAYRMICSNGIVAGGGMSSRIYHSANSIKGFDEMLKNTVQNLPKLMETMETLRGIRLDYDATVAMATKAASLRWKKYNSDSDERGSFYTDNTVAQLTHLQRAEDIGADAYLLFNRIQENVLRGNVFVRSVTDLGALKVVSSVIARRERCPASKNTFASTKRCGTLLKM
jgi:hypothetical protein